MEISKLEFDELYGDYEVVFDNYYKYSFTYKGKTNSGDTIVVTFGGCADDIYKVDVTAGEKVRVRDIDATYAAVREVGEGEGGVHSYTDY